MREIAMPLEQIRQVIADNIGGQTLQFGDNLDTEFFIIKLRDKYAYHALRAYAQEAMHDGETEYANEILELANRALHHPNKKKPD